MENTYYNPADLSKFGDISSLQPEMGNKFFSYYSEVFKEGALTEREKSLIALAVAHAVLHDWTAQEALSKPVEGSAPLPLPAHR